MFVYVGVWVGGYIVVMRVVMIEFFYFGESEMDKFNRVFFDYLFCVLFLMLDIS